MLALGGQGALITMMDEPVRLGGPLLLGGHPSHMPGVLQYSCLENPRDEGAWWAAVSGVAQTKRKKVTLQWKSLADNDLIR